MRLYATPDTTICFSHCDAATWIGQMTTTLLLEGVVPHRVLFAQSHLPSLLSDIFHWSTYGADIGGIFSICYEAVFDPEMC
jgi:hypothetical protein